MIIEIDDDIVDDITRTCLADSYVSIAGMLKQPKSWHEDDVASWKELLPALKIVGGWYSIDFDAEIKKAKKRMK
jgi:hypothetical protein